MRCIIGEIFSRGDAKFFFTQRRSDAKKKFFFSQRRGGATFVYVKAQRTVISNEPTVFYYFRANWRSEKSTAISINFLATARRR
jgi:hypothetical protein